MVEAVVTSTALIAVLIALRAVFKGKIDPRLQYGLWLLVALRLLMPFSLAASPLSILNAAPAFGLAEQAEGPASPDTKRPAGPINAGAAEMAKRPPGAAALPGNPVESNTADPEASFREPPGPADILTAIWLTGAAAVGLWFALQNAWFYTRLKKTRKRADISEAHLPVYTTVYVKSPCLFGLRPAIYMHPRSLEDDGARGWILAHEETHWRHGDHIWPYLRCLCLALHWFNPLVWWAAALSRRDCELACDAGTLKRVGDGNRKAYGQTLLAMIEGRAGPSALLCGATSMSSGPSGIRERITMIAKKPKMLLPALLAVVLVTAAAVGCTFTGARKPAEDVTAYERAGMSIAIPDAYAPQLLIDPAERGDEDVLLDVYQKSSYEKYPGAGFLFSIVRYTQARYEQFLCSDGSGQSFFAKDDTFYYGFFTATDVQAPDDYEAYTELLAEVGDFVKSDMIARNGLDPYSDDAFFGREYTYDGAHVFLRYHPYYATNGSREEIWTLALSQPVKQGDGGIWCVERWKDQHGNVYPYFPDANGTPSAEYYADWQARSDSGADTSRLDPLQVALAFVREVFDHAPATAESFTPVDSFDAPADLFAASTGDIHDYMPQLLAGDDVSGYELLPCLEGFTHGIWREFDEAYGPDWWNPLWSALSAAAVGDMPGDGRDQLLRSYYIGKGYLASDGAYAEGLSDLVRRQWDADPASYSACLDSRFSAEEGAALRRAVVYSISYYDGPFSLAIPGSMCGIYLGAYPVEFPFGCDLAENGRQTYRAESFGPVTVVEADGLQVTYLNPAEGVYTVITLRAMGEGCTAAGVAIGDVEKILLAHGPGSLREIREISYDDAAWFGSSYDKAYAYTPEDGTKSVLYLIKGGAVSGIEIINGLDGPMY